MATSNAAIDEIRPDFSLAPLDFVNSNQMKLDVWDASAPSEVTIKLYDAAGIFLATAMSSTSVGNEWEQLNFDFSTIPFTIDVAKAIIQFDLGSILVAGKVYYIDNLKMDGYVTRIRNQNVTSLIGDPNPTQDFYMLSLGDLDLNEELTLNIVSIDGKLISTAKLNNYGKELALDLRTLDAGIYMIELSSNKQTWINKVIKD